MLHTWKEQDSFIKYYRKMAGKSDTIFSQLLLFISKNEGVIFDIVLEFFEWVRKIRKKYKNISLEYFGK